MGLITDSSRGICRIAVGGWLPSWTDEVKYKLYFFSTFLTISLSALSAAVNQCNKLPEIWYGNYRRESMYFIILVSCININSLVIIIKEKMSAG